MFLSSAIQNSIRKTPLKKLSCVTYAGKMERRDRRIIWRTGLNVSPKNLIRACMSAWKGGPELSLCPLSSTFPY